MLKLGILSIIKNKDIEEHKDIVPQKEFKHIHLEITGKDLKHVMKQ